MAVIYCVEYPVEESFDHDGNLCDFDYLDSGTFTRMEECDTWKDALARLRDYGHPCDSFTHDRTATEYVFPVREGKCILARHYKVFDSDAAADMAAENDMEGFARYSGM